MIDDLGKASPSDELVKKAQVDAHMKYANFLMYESTAASERKISVGAAPIQTCCHHRPQQRRGKENINLIEGIYNQMGRPIPQ